MSYFNSNLPFIRKQKKISQEELAKKVGVDQSTVSLWEKGMDTTVEKAFQVAEALEVPFPEFLGKDLRFDNADFVDITNDTIQIPVYGVIKAGIPVEAQQDILEYVDIPRNWLKGNKTFYGLRISGDSMYPRYSENDIVIFEYNDDYSIANKKDCAVMVNGYDATFKNITITDDGITLVPLNINNSDNYQPTFYSKEQVEKLPVKIVGIAREKRTRL